MRFTGGIPDATDTPPWTASFGAALLGLGALYTYTLHGNSYACAGMKACAKIIHYSPLIKIAILTLAGISLVYAVAVRFTSWGTAIASLAGLLGVVALGYGGMWLINPIVPKAGVLPLLGGILLIAAVSGTFPRHRLPGHEDTS